MLRYLFPLLQPPLSYHHLSRSHLIALMNIILLLIARTECRCRNLRRSPLRDTKHTLHYALAAIPPLNHLFKMRRANISFRPNPLLQPRMTESFLLRLIFPHLPSRPHPHSTQDVCHFMSQGSS